MIDKVKSVGNFIVNGVEKLIDLIIDPIVGFFDWIARKWLSHELSEKDSFIQFLETAMAEQRLSLTKYIQQNKSLSERLEKYQKYGEEDLIKQSDWLAREASRINGLLHEQMENNEKLNIANAKMRAAGDILAETVALNKPKKYITKKDRQIKKAIDGWNLNSR